MNNNNKLRLFVIILFLFLSCSFFAAKKTYAIYRKNLNTTVRLSILDPSSTVRIYLDSNGGNETYSDPIVKNINQEVGVLPIPTRNRYNFIGWWTDPDDGEGTKVEATDVLLEDAHYYAHWAKLVCKKATTRHEEICAQTVASNGCRVLGYAQSSTITYGTIPGPSSPLPGDAYDCDVNDDGIYDADTERFYFMRENTDVSDRAALVLFTNFDEHGLCDDHIDRGSYLYDVAKTYLPTSATWSNSALVEFDGKVSRFINEDDLTEACGPIVYSNTSYLSTCQFFLENSRFQSASLGRSGIWIEHGATYQRIHANSVYVATVAATSSNAARPVIEIPMKSLEGYRERRSFNVTFDANGGTPAISSRVRYEDQVLGALPEAPTREGYRFLGWFDSNEEEVTSDRIITGTVVFHANWEEVIDNLEYVFRIPGTCSFGGSSADITSDNSDCISTINPTGNPIDYTASANKYIDTGISLYSEDNYDKDYEVGFTIVNYVGGDNTNQATLFNTKLENSSLYYPGLVFRKSGNSAGAFQLTQKIKNHSSDATITFANPITSTHPISVIIKRVSGVFSYSFDGGEFIELQDINEYANDEFNMHAWFGAAGTSAAATATTAGATRYASATLSNMYIKLEAEASATYTVSFYPNGDSATVSFSSKQVPRGSAVGELPIAGRPGYMFDGWYTQASGGERVTESTVIGSDKDYFAHWKDIYLVAFYPLGGTLSPTTNPIEVVDGGTVGTLPTAEKTGWVFDGWYTSGTGGTAINGDEIINSDVDYYAHYKEKFNVTFEAYGGTLSPSTNPIEVVDGGTVGTLPTAEKTGWVFDGWWTASTSGATVTGAETITGNTTYHAHYKEKFNVTFETYGGTLIPSTNPIEVVDGGTIGDLPGVNKEGSIFVGWFTSGTGGTAVTGTEIITGNTTYHAQYATPITITFNTDGGDPAIITRTIAINSQIGDLPDDSDVTKTGYVLDGWYMDDGNGNYTVPVTSSTVFNTDTTVMAKWISSNYVAMIGSQGYESLEAAVAAVPTTGVKTTITLLKNVAVTSSTTISSSKNIELNLQNFTLSNDSTAIFDNSGTLNIINGTIINRGPESSGKNAAIQNKAGSVLNISGGTLQATQTNIIINRGTVNITGGRLESIAQSACINNESGGILTMSGGQIVETSTTKGQTIYNNGGTVTISGNVYLENKSQTGSSSGRAALHNNAGTMYIYSGTIVSKANAAVKNNGTMYIGTNDETFDNTSPVMQGFNNGLETVSGKTVNIYDGIFKGNGTTADKAISNESYIDYDTANAELIHEFETIDGVQYDTAYLSPKSVSVKYTVTFNASANGGSSTLSTTTLDEGSQIGDLPNATKTGTHFLGWFSSSSGGEKLLPTTVIEDDITYYARFTTSSTVCRVATSLHSATINSSTTSFGQLYSGGILSPGDALDCDVNGDGTFDAATERFYYLTDDGGNAILIFYNNTSATSSTPICGATAISYGTNGPNEGPTNAMTWLPDTSQWTNVSLYSEPRDITNASGAIVVDDFVYAGKAARFATVEEIKAATSNSINGTTNELASYTFLLENTPSYTSGCRSNYWLETQVGSENKIYRIDGAAANKKLGNANGSSGIRPVIEVPYSAIDGVLNIVEFDTLSTAMRTYFDNISTWAAGQTDSSHSSYDTYMTNNLDNNKCVYFTNDNRDTEVNYSSGWNVYCDQPNQYDTGVTGEVNVYEYNESAGTVSSTIASYVTANNGKLYNFIPNKVYYWESATDSSKNGYVRAIGERRVISIDNTTPTPQPKYKMRNVRDLGGLPVDTDGNGTIDGTIKYAKLFRSERVWGSYNSTAPLLRKLGINHELDLRADSEVDTNKDDTALPRITSNPANVNNKVFEIIHYEIDYDAYNANYLLARNAVATTMYEFVKAHDAGDDTYSLIFHCRIGADRTGTFAYIVEGLLGVPTEERYRDYELTVFFGLRERTRFYKEKEGSSSSNAKHKFQYLKSSIRNAGDGVTEDVRTWFLKDGNTATVIDQDTKESVTVNLPDLIDDFKAIMIDYN